MRAFPSRDAIALCYRRPKAQGVDLMCDRILLHFRLHISHQGQKGLMKPPPFVPCMFEFITCMTFFLLNNIYIYISISKNMYDFYIWCPC